MARTSSEASAPLDPFDDSAILEVRRWMQNEIDDGSDPDALRSEIATRLWPWARNLARSATRRLPAHADQAEIHSSVATALWQCCATFDPDPSPTWAAWVQMRLRGAVVDAIRASDHLSRRDRRRLLDGDSDVPVAELRAIDAELLADQRVDDPQAAVIDSTLAGELRRWMAQDLPESTAGRLEAWWRTTGATTSLPASLAAEIAPYRFRLAVAVELLS